ncbi:Repressor of RNA polymerase III transcription MAF1-like protein [Armadillidium nasatum]|uniref:Repressor of RNA polymerase III transcription MAF1-like protein n=1 Tax=Armadillidium nasatum TaxID=96803 RepID=A0A5N5TIX2_9CRUS|nr:Repressor of RNA polymerase III transcription MAF1-like protein [Armadillidium nasatum]
MHLTSLEVLILLIGRLESYSCKMIGEEKAQYKRFNSDVVPRVNDMEVLSPPQTLSEFADDLCFHRQASEWGCGSNDDLRDETDHDIPLEATQSDISIPTMEKITQKNSPELRRSNRV